MWSDVSASVLHVHTHVDTSCTWCVEDQPKISRPPSHDPDAESVLYYNVPYARCLAGSFLSEAWIDAFNLHQRERKGDEKVLARGVVLNCYSTERHA